MYTTSNHGYNHNHDYSYIIHDGQNYIYENPFDSTNYLLKPVKRKNIDFTPDETNRLKQIKVHY